MIYIITDIRKFIQKYKYLVPDDLSMAQFMFVIRKRIKLKPEESIYTFINKKIIVNGIFEPYSEEINILLLEIKYVKTETPNVI